MLKRPPPKKLTFTTTTIRILSEAEAKQAGGGLSMGCSDLDCPITKTNSRMAGCP